MKGKEIIKKRGAFRCKEEPNKGGGGAGGKENTSVVERGDSTSLRMGVTSGVTSIDTMGVELAMEPWIGNSSM